MPYKAAMSDPKTLDHAGSRGDAATAAASACREIAEHGTSQGDKEPKPIAMETPSPSPATVDEKGTITAPFKELRAGMKYSYTCPSPAPQNDIQRQKRQKIEHRAEVREITYYNRKRRPIIVKMVQFDGNGHLCRLDQIPADATFAEICNTITSRRH